MCVCVCVCVCVWVCLGEFTFIQPFNSEMYLAQATFFWRITCLQTEVFILVYQG